MHPYTVIVETRDGETSETPFSFEFEARRFAREESKWENTKRVRCPELNIDIIGDFA